jgi:hypothetical protein
MWERAEAGQLWTCGGITVTTVKYHAERYSWTESHPDGIDAAVLMRHGAYRRRADGIEGVVDPNTGCFRQRGGESSVANFTGEPEEFTVIALELCLLDSLFALPKLPAGSFAVTPEIDLRHRMLLREAATGSEGVEEDVISLVASVSSNEAPTSCADPVPAPSRIGAAWSATPSRCSTPPTAPSRCRNSPVASGRHRSISAACSGRSPAARSRSTGCASVYEPCSTDSARARRTSLCSPTPSDSLITAT